MTSHGLSGFRRLVLGSVSEKVLRHSNLPVFLIHDDTEKKRRANHEVTADEQGLSLVNQLELLGDTRHKMRVRVQDEVWDMNDLFQMIVTTKTEEEAIRWMTALGKKIGKSVLITHSYISRKSQGQLVLRCILRSFDLPFVVGHTLSATQYNLPETNFDQQETALFDLLVTSALHTVLPDAALNMTANYKEGDSQIMLAV